MLSFTSDKIFQYSSCKQSLLTIYRWGQWITLFQYILLQYNLWEHISNAFSLILLKESGLRLILYQANIFLHQPFRQTGKQNDTILVKACNSTEIGALICQVCSKMCGDARKIILFLAHLESFKKSCIYFSSWRASKITESNHPVWHNNLCMRALQMLIEVKLQFQIPFLISKPRKLYYHFTFICVYSGTYRKTVWDQL